MESDRYFTADLMNTTDALSAASNSKISIASNIIDKSNNYRIGVSTATFSTVDIPITIWGDDYRCGIIYNGTLYSGVCPFTDFSNSSDFSNEVHSISQICDSFNTGMATAYALANAAGAGLTLQPKLYYASGRFSLFAETAFDIVGGTCQIVVSSSWNSFIFHAFANYWDITYAFPAYRNNYVHIILFGPQKNNLYTGNVEALTLSAAGTKRLFTQYCSSNDTMKTVLGIKIYLDQARILGQYNTSVNSLAGESSTRDLQRQYLLTTVYLSGSRNGRIVYSPEIMDYISFQYDGPLSSMTLMYKYFDGSSSTERDLRVYYKLGHTTKLEFTLE